MANTESKTTLAVALMLLSLLFPRLEYCLQLAAMLDSLLGVQHHHRVAPDHRHADGVPLPGLWGVNMIMISHDDTL